MACPYSGISAPTEKHPALRDIDVPPVVIYPTIAEPVELRKFAKDAIYVLGGQYAILIQWLHPGLARGSIEHSDFADRILHRLKTTSRFLNAAVFGTPKEKEAIFSVIHRKHATVVGEDYFADDPELHKWTAATLFMSLLVVHEAFFGPLSRPQKEKMFKESAVYATSLRMPPEMWPATLDDFFKYWDHNIATLPITQWARDLAKSLLWPRNTPLLLQPQWPVARLLTTMWLPERLRVGYGLKDTKMRRRVYGAVRVYIKVTYPLIPGVVRRFPHKHGLKDMRKAVERIEEKGTWVKAG